MKSISKWNSILAIITIIIIAIILSGPTDVSDKEKNSEMVKILSPEQTSTDIILPLSFDIPDLNVKVEMRCNDFKTPHSGYSWNVLSLDKHSPPAATEIFFNFVKTKHDVILPSGWRGIKSPFSKVPIGDAFMMTAIQLKKAGAQRYNYYIFTVANTLKDAQTSKSVEYVPVEVVSFISNATLHSSPCSSIQIQ